MSNLPYYDRFAVRKLQVGARIDVRHLYLITSDGRTVSTAVAEAVAEWVQRRAPESTWPSTEEAILRLANARKVRSKEAAHKLRPVLQQAELLDFAGPEVGSFTGAQSKAMLAQMSPEQRAATLRGMEAVQALQADPLPVVEPQAPQAAEPPSQALAEIQARELARAANDREAALARAQNRLTDPTTSV